LFKDIDQGLLRCADILNHLKSFRDQTTVQKGDYKDSDLKEDASTYEDHSRW
jgi:hypothetical protein